MKVGSFAFSMVLMIAVCSILIVIGVGVTANLQTAMPALTGAAGVANQTSYVVFNNVFSAFSLSSVLPIVVIAALLISGIIAAFTLFKNSGAGSL